MYGSGTAALAERTRSAWILKMNLFRRRIGLANTYDGGILITTVILIFGYSTPRLLKWVAKGLAHFAG